MHIRHDLIAIGFLLLFSIGTFWNGIYDPYRTIQEDIALCWQGLHAAANEQIWQGRFPHWNPYGLGGERLYANILLGLFYPGSILFRILPFPTACLLSWILHYAATALCMYALARSLLKVAPSVAVLAAILFTFGGFSLGHCNHLNFVFALPWFALLLLASVRFHSSQGRAGHLWWAIGLSCMCCLILSGGLPIVFMALFTLAWMMAFLIMRDLREGQYRAAGRLIGGVACMGLCTLGLTAFQLMPTVDLYAGSSRSDWTSSVLFAGGIPWRTLFYQLIAPGVLGNQTIGSWGQVSHETSVFIGGAGLTLAMFGILAWRAHPWVLPLLILLLLSTILALGDTPVLRALHGLIPLVKVRQPSRYVMLIQFALAMLATIGFQSGVEFCGRSKSRLRSGVCVAVFLLISISTLLLLRWIDGAGASSDRLTLWLASQPQAVKEWLRDVSPRAIANVTTSRELLLTISFAIWCVGPLIVWMSFRLIQQRQGVAIGGLYTWVALELVLFATGTWANRDRFPGVAEQPTPIVEFLKQNLGQDRYFNSAVYMPLWENRGAVYGLANLDGYVGSRLNVSREHELLFSQMHGSLQELNLFSTKYVLLTEGRDRGSHKQVFRDGNIVVCENPWCTPRAAFLTELKSMSGIEETIQIMKTPAFDPQRTGLVTGTARLFDDTAPSPDSSESCQITQWDPGCIEIDVECRIPRWVFIGASYDAGWHGTLDGRACSLNRTNVCFMSAAVPSGRHILRLTYWTPMLREGVAVSVVTLGVIICTTAVSQYLHGKTVRREQ